MQLPQKMAKKAEAGREQTVQENAAQDKSVRDENVPQAKVANQGAVQPVDAAQKLDEAGKGGTAGDAVQDRGGNKNLAAGGGGVAAPLKFGNGSDKAQPDAQSGASERKQVAGFGAARPAAKSAAVPAGQPAEATKAADAKNADVAVDAKADRPAEGLAPEGRANAVDLNGRFARRQLANGLAAGMGGGRGGGIAPIANGAAVDGMQREALAEAPSGELVVVRLKLAEGDLQRQKRAVETLLAKNNIEVVLDSPRGDESANQQAQQAFRNRSGELRSTNEKQGSPSAPESSAPKAGDAPRVASVQSAKTDQKEQTAQLQRGLGSVAGGTGPAGGGLAQAPAAQGQIGGEAAAEGKPANGRIELFYIEASSQQIESTLAGMSQLEGVQWSYADAGAAFNSMAPQTFAYRGQELKDISGPSANSARVADAVNEANKNVDPAGGKKLLDIQKDQAPVLESQIADKKKGQERQLNRLSTDEVDGKKLSGEKDAPDLLRTSRDKETAASKLADDSAPAVEKPTMAPQQQFNGGRGKVAGATKGSVPAAPGNRVPPAKALAAPAVAPNAAAAPVPTLPAAPAAPSLPTAPPAPAAPPPPAAAEPEPALAAAGATPSLKGAMKPGAAPIAEAGNKLAETRRAESKDAVTSDV
jgi:hypothetical protein